MKKTFLVLAITFLIYLISGKAQPPQAGYFVPLAQSFLQGKLYVEKVIRYVNDEMVSTEEVKTGKFENFLGEKIGKYYVIFPPLPAVLLIPAVILWGDQTNQGLFSILIASLSTVIAFQVFKAIKLSENKSLWLTALFAFGSMQWYHAVIGSGWYFASICAMFFLWLAIWATLKKKNFLLIGFLLGCGYLCRFPVILAFPFFIFMTKDYWWQRQKVNLSPFVFFFWGLSFCVILSFAYNFARYGTIANLGYTLLEKRYYNIMSGEYSLGSYSLTYFPRHLKAIFWSFPTIVNRFPYLLPNYLSMALWVVMPAVILLFWAPLKERVVWASWLAILPVAFLAHLFHGGVGASQFGYRFALDYMPFLLLIIAQAIKKNFYWWQKGLFILSIAINFWGIYCSFWLS